MNVSNSRNSVQEILQYSRCSLIEKVARCRDVSDAFRRRYHAFVLMICGTTASTSNASKAFNAFCNCV